MLQAVPEFRPTMKDYQLEADMKHLLEQMEKAASKEAKRHYWKRYKALHQQRSPTMVAYLEAQRGLTHE